MQQETTKTVDVSDLLSHRFGRNWKPVCDAIRRGSYIDPNANNEISPYFGALAFSAMLASYEPERRQHLLGTFTQSAAKLRVATDMRPDYQDFLRRHFESVTFIEELGPGKKMKSDVMSHLEGFDLFITERGAAMRNGTPGLAQHALAGATKILTGAKSPMRERLAGIYNQPLILHVTTNEVNRMSFLQFAKLLGKDDDGAKLELGQKIGMAYSDTSIPKINIGGFTLDLARMRSLELPGNDQIQTGGKKEAQVSIMSSINTVEAALTKMVDHFPSIWMMAKVRGYINLRIGENLTPLSRIVDGDKVLAAQVDEAYKLIADKMEGKNTGSFTDNPLHNPNLVAAATGVALLNELQMRL